MTRDEFARRSAALGHAIQSAVAYEIESGKSTDTTPKHLRVGVNMAMSETGALGELLIKKGIITEDEYFRAIILYLDNELSMYERKHGVKFA